jgi:GNAT superfamily N-acetyltransferase
MQQQRSNVASAQTTCIVCPPEPGDYYGMAGLAGQLGYPCTGDQIRMRVAEMRDTIQYAIYVARLPGGQIAGWIGVYLFRAVEIDSCAEISGLIVDQQVRSRGIGKALLDAVEVWARSHGCAAILVHSNVKRDRAHGFYKKNGYERTKTQELLRKSLIGAKLL